MSKTGNVQVCGIDVQPQTVLCSAVAIGTQIAEDPVSCPIAVEDSCADWKGKIVHDRLLVHTDGFVDGLEEQGSTEVSRLLDCLIEQLVDRLAAEQALHVNLFENQLDQLDRG